jgi:MtrB/PioB family decaheme-associated outer membrane protein
MKPRLISILVANIIVASAPLFAADGGMEWSGSASVGARHVDDKAADPSKLNEYRDLDSGVIGGFEVRGRGDTYYLNGYGENLGRDDQYLDLKGGIYGTLKYRLYSDELRHNFGSGPGARSPFSGIGSPVLTATLPNANPATWNTFDHSYRRRDWGGMAEWQTASPWYIRGEANEVTRKGINVFGGAQGTSPGNGFMDLPSPIDYKTRNYSAEGGYSTKRTHVAVNVLHSKFSNDNEVLRWTNGFFGGLDTTILPPDNELTRLSVNGNLRQLPGASTLAGRVTYSKLTDDVLMQQTMLSTGGAFRATNPSSPSFHGELKTTTVSLSLSSHPVNNLDTRVYWNYAKEDNDSTRVHFSPAAGTGLTGGSNNPLANCNSTATNPCEPEFFHYKKHNLGVEAGYRVNRANKISAGFDYYDVDRERIDFHSNEDKKVFVEWKNSSLDALTGRLKYQYMTRRSEFVANAAAVAANPIDAFVRRFDLANVDQNLVKVVLDASPVPFLDLGFEAIYKNNDYKDTILGRTEDRRQEYYASLSFGDPRKFRVLVFGDVEFVQFDSFHRVGTGNPDPATPPTAATYNWSAENKDRAWQVGLGADWVAMQRLTLKGSLIWAKTEGTTDFAAQVGAPVAPFLPIRNFDNTRRTALNLRAVYNFSKQWEFTGGYAYEKYRYSDIGYDNTQYVVPAAAPASNAYVTGQFSFQPYTANIFYAVAKYKF